MTADRHLRVAGTDGHGTADEPIGFGHPTLVHSGTSTATAPITLAPSPLPNIVFAGLAARSTPTISDVCVVDLIDGDGRQTQLTHPDANTFQLLDRAGGPVVTVPFDSREHEAPELVDAAGVPAASRFHGLVTFGWRDREPTSQDRAIVALLVQHAVQTVVWQREAAAQREAASEVEGLRSALQSSRNIGAAVGILMGLHKVTQDEAFGLLRNASQRSNVKLRELALDVLDTGWLDPQLLDSGSAAHGGGGSPGPTPGDPRITNGASIAPDPRQRAAIIPSSGEHT